MQSSAGIENSLRHGAALAPVTSISPGLPRTRAAHDRAITWSPQGHYDLAATLDSGQAFRWSCDGEFWHGVVGGEWFRLTRQGDAIHAEAASSPCNWERLRSYLQIDCDIDSVTARFPTDPAMTRALAACRGLRLLRQDPWECLASFILSSTKQIVQIRQIVDLLCRSFGEEIPAGSPSGVAFAFPSASQLAAASESDLRACKMGFRAPYLLATARVVDSGKLDLESLRHKSFDEARQALIALPGVGEKIADCVLLFAYGFPQAFPVDVWIHKALNRLYFPKRRRSPAQLQAFVQEYFRPHAGYAQQYLFHYMRLFHGRDPVTSQS